MNSLKTKLSFGDERAHATLEQRGNALWLTLDDRTNHRRWGPAPLLQLEIYEKMLFRAETLNEYRIDAIEKIPNGVYLTIGDASLGIRLGLWVRIINGELSVLLLPAEVYEDKPALCRLFSVIILPGLTFTAGQGTLILPLNTGYTCQVAHAPKAADRFMIYGEQSRWELLPMLPIAAMHTPTGGLMMMATSGASDTECHVSTDGAGGGEIGFGISLRQNWPDPVEFAPRQLVYTPVPATADPVNFVAKRLRRHVMADLGKPTLKQRASESPEVAYLLQAFTMKLFYGMENNSITMNGAEKTDHITFNRLMTFAEAEKLLRGLRAEGVDKVNTQSVGWNPRGHDGMWPTRFPIEERLGGEKGFRQLIENGNASVST